MSGFSFTLDLTHGLDCSVCGQSLLHEAVCAGELVAVTFGFKQYAICCCCHQEVYRDDAKDRNYRARWRRWYRKLVKNGQVTCTGEDTKILKGE